MKKLAKTRKYIKKNVTSLIFFMILLVMVLMIIVVVSVLVPTASTSQYGDRLEGINEVLISDEAQNKIVADLKAESIVGLSKVRIVGRIVNVEIELNSSGTIDKGKELAELTIEKFDKDEIAYYDFQIFITSTGDKGTTVIGYKTPKAKKLTWTNN